MAVTTNAQLASQVFAAIQKINAREAQLRDWLAGSATGGPNGDGRFPITNMSGDTFLYESLARLIDMVEGPAGAADKARLLSETARDASVAAQLAAHDDAEAAGLSRKDAAESRDLARQYRDDAASHAYNLQVTRDTTDSLRESAQLARDEAVSAKTTAVSAKDVTLVARGEAVAARDEAEAFALSINPAILATKSDLADEIAKLVGSAPETLNALDELAQALGNDPNFATTITTQLAGKAALAHTHVLADIVGLQTALDAKQPVGSYVTTSGFTWSALADKPATFAPAPHRHSWSDLDNVPGSFTPSGHRHAMSDIDGLQDALNAKQGTGTYLQPNSTLMPTQSLFFRSAWGNDLQIGGGSDGSAGARAAIVTTNGNLHMDASKTGDGKGIYLNWYGGSGLIIGRGDSVHQQASFNDDGMTLGFREGVFAVPTRLALDNTYTTSGNSQNLKVQLFRINSETYGFGLNNDAGIEYHSTNAAGKHQFFVNGAEVARFHAGGLSIGSRNVTAELDTKVAKITDQLDVRGRIHSGFYQHDAARQDMGWPETQQWQHMIASTHSNEANYYSMQIAGSFYNQEFYGRKTAGNGSAGWSRFWTSANLGDLADNLFNNNASSHTQPSPDSINRFGSTHVGYEGGPGTGSAQFYSLALGLGKEYGPGSYMMQVMFPRDNGDSYLSFRTKEAGAWQGWRKVKAGDSDRIGGVSLGNLAGPVAAQSTKVTGLWQFNSQTANGVNSGVNPPLQAFADNGGSAYMSFHRGGQYAVNFGLDSDNVLRIGGWSAAANRWTLDMSGNCTVDGSMAVGWGGFKQATYQSNARNPIWRFGNADGYGLSYFQGGAGVEGDTIAFHFGDPTAAASILQITPNSVFVGGQRVARVVSSAVGGGRIFVQGDQPGGMVQGDIWLKPI